MSCVSFVSGSAGGGAGISAGAATVIREMSKENSPIPITV